MHMVFTVDFVQKPFYLSESMNMILTRCTVTVDFDDSFQSWLSPSGLHLHRCARQTQHLRFEISFRPEDHTDWEGAPPSDDLLSWGSLDYNEHFTIFDPQEPLLELSHLE